MNKSLLIFLSLPLLCANAWAEDSALVVTKTARPAAAGLKVKTSLVPTYDLYQKKVLKGKSEVYKTKAIPVLDIGEERQVQAAALTPLRLSIVETTKSQDIRRHPPIPVVGLKMTPYNLTVGNPKQLTNSEAFAKIPEIKILTSVAAPATEEPHVNLVKMDELKPNDYKLLQALIFLEIQKNYELALGLFAELTEVPEHRIEALYNYAQTARGLELNSEFREYMIQVVKESKSKEWQQKAAEALVKNITILQRSDIALIDPLVAKFELDVTKNDDYQLTRAKYYSEVGQLGQVEDALIYISESSPLYPEALMLNGLLNYRLGKVDEAVINLDRLMQITESDKTSQIRAIGALTLARMQFQKSQYKDSFQSYLKVDKSNPLWLQAMIESAWTQILGEDYEGAAGNMFSLHTDFFKNAFAPESYVVRTVGYLNLCQYGDGAGVLNEMRRKYGTWKKKLDAYDSTHKDALNYYDTVKNWLKNSDLKEVDGLPRSFIVELARHPSFLSVQKQINTYEDEASRFNKISLNLITIERDVLAKETAARKELADAKKKITSTNSEVDGSFAVQSAEKKLLAYGIQYHIANKARTSIKTLRTRGLARIDKEEAAFRKTAAKTLQSHFAQLSANLNKVLEQNDILQYELYSGAGEHIRYQMAGGDVNTKERAELKVEKEKSLNWKFKGEIWEDEVGHYRSSLKNVCPKEANVAGLAQ